MLLSIKNLHDAEGGIQKWMWVIFKVPLAIRFYFTYLQVVNQFKAKLLLELMLTINLDKRWVN